MFDHLCVSFFFKLFYVVYYSDYLDISFNFTPTLKKILFLIGVY